MMHAPIELRVTRDAQVELDYEGSSSWGFHSSNCTPSAMQGAVWVQLTQTLIPNDKVNDGAYLGLRTNFPPGTWTNHSNPQASTGIAWAFLIPSFTGFVKSISRGSGPGVHRGGPGPVRADRQRLPGRWHRPVRQAVGDDQLRALVRRRRRQDDPRRPRLRRRDVEPRGRHGRHGDVGADRALPVHRPAGEAEHRRARGATAAAPATRRCGWRGRRRSTRCRTSATGGCSSRPGCGAATPPRPGTAATSATRTSSSWSSAASPTRRTSPTPPTRRWSGWSPGERQFDLDGTTLPEVMRQGDLYLCMFRGGAGSATRSSARRSGRRRRRRVPAAALRGVGVRRRRAERPRGRDEARRARDRRQRGRRRCRCASGCRTSAADPRRELIEPVQRMYAESIRLSENGGPRVPRVLGPARGLHFEVPTPTVELSKTLLSEQDRARCDSTPRRCRPLDETLPRSRRVIQSSYKDPDRFDQYVALLQARVEWSDRIVPPSDNLFIVEKGRGTKARARE